MTRYEMIIGSKETLAQNLIQYNDFDGMFYTSDGEPFETSKDAIKHELEWLDGEIKSQQSEKRCVYEENNQVARSVEKAYCIRCLL